MPYKHSVAKAFSHSLHNLLLGLIVSHFAYVKSFRIISELSHCNYLLQQYEANSKLSI